MHAPCSTQRSATIYFVVISMPLILKPKSEPILYSPPPTHFPHVHQTSAIRCRTPYDNLIRFLSSHSLTLYVPPFSPSIFQERKKITKRDNSLSEFRQTIVTRLINTQFRTQTTSPLNAWHIPLSHPRNAQRGKFPMRIAMVASHPTFRSQAAIFCMLYVVKRSHYALFGFLSRSVRSVHLAHPHIKQSPPTPHTIILQQEKEKETPT